MLDDIRNGTVKSPEELLLDALSSPDPTAAASAWAVALRDRGMNQPEMYRLLTQVLAGLSPNEASYDVVADLLDRVHGGSWAKGRAIFGTELQQPRTPRR